MPLAGWCVDPEVLENIRVHIILLVCCNDGMSFSGYRGGGIGCWVVPFILCGGCLHRQGWCSWFPLAGGVL